MEGDADRNESIPVRRAGMLRQKEGDPLASSMAERGREGELERERAFGNAFGKRLWTTTKNIREGKEGEQNANAHGWSGMAGKIIFEGPVMRE